MTAPRADAEHLRREFIRRVDAHPVHTWPPAVLAALIALFDLAWPRNDRKYAALRLVQGDQ